MSYFSIFLIVALSYSLLMLITQLNIVKNGRLKDYIITSLIAMLSIEIFYGIAYNNNLIYDYPILLRLNTPFILLVAPAIYMLYQSEIDPSFSFRRKHIIHIVPFFVCLLYFSPLFLSPGHVKVLYAESMYQSPNFDSYLWGGIRRVQQFGYIGFIFYKISIKYDWKGFKHLVFRSPVSFYVLFFFSLLWIVSMLRYFLDFSLLTANIDIGILSIYVIAMVIYLFSSNRKSNTERYKGSTLSLDEKVSFMNIIQEHVEHKKLFTNASLSLPTLSKITGIPVPKISQIINQELGFNFNTYINQLRVKEAKHQLVQPENKHFTIEAIAKDAGFNSISSFNSNFKKIMGVTPNQFRKSLIS